MGMFDSIIYEANCFNCKHPLSDFQSKSGRCELQKLTPAELYEQGGSQAIFYAYCDTCNIRNDFNMRPIPSVLVKAKGEQ